MSYARKSYSTFTRKSGSRVKGGPTDPAEVLEDGIYRATGVVCTVRITDMAVFIATTDYADYLLAKSTIRGRISKPIHREILP